MPFVNKYLYRKSNKAFNNYGNTILLKTKTALDEINVDFWLDFGTLLGVHRDGKLIGHDTDVDIAIYLEDYSERIEQAMIKQGFTYSRRCELEKGKRALEQSFCYKGVYIDIFYYSKRGDKNICHIFFLNESKNRIPREVYTTNTGFKKIVFLDKEWNIPSNPDLRLIETYGPDYKIPLPNWHTPRDCLNSKILNEIGDVHDFSSEKKPSY
jgi:hypothetical protein